MIIHAGGGDELRYQPDEFTAVHWWTTAPVPVDGVFGRHFTLNPEGGGIGIFCHELGHLMGLPDLYDKVSPPSAGIGQWSLMCGGIAVGAEGIPVDFDAWSKTRLGFVNVVPVFYDRDAVTIPPSSVTDKVYRLWGNGADGSEYFLLENRQKSGLDRVLPGQGIMIYHIDDRVPGNDSAEHYKVALEQADGLYQLEGEPATSSTTGTPAIRSTRATCSRPTPSPPAPPTTAPIPMSRSSASRVRIPTGR